jgi:hypothetical protein
VQAGLLGLALAVVLASPASGAKKKPTRFSLAGGCYGLRSVSSGSLVAGAGQIRMQATTLGSYLLYRPDRTVLAAQEDGSVAPAGQPSPAADWRVAKAGRRKFTLSPASAPESLLRVGPDGSLSLSSAEDLPTRFRFARSRGCAVYPEAELNATGKPKRGKTRYGAVGGFLEGHNHWMTYEIFGGDFRCGRPWHPYGIPYALPDCSEVEGPQGSAAPMQNFFNFGNPSAAHDTTGWPKLTEWRADNLTYEGQYWRWIQRAWMSGLRLMVMGVNENRELCQLQARRRYSCDEMTTVRRGYESIRELKRYVDAQAGGPGKGFFAIVTNPYQARRVINRGKMAVVLEIEVSEPFGCRGWESPTCDRASLKRELDDMYRLGVRSSLLLNKFDNPLAGVRFDSGPFGAVINAGNRNSAGTFWSAETCKGPYKDNEIETFEPGANAFLDSQVAALGVANGTFPTYPPPPHCNTRGLTELGRYLAREMIKRHMIINPDHMSQRAVEDTLTLAESQRYSGVISPHGWMDPGNWPRIWKLGGLAFPDSDTSPGYIQAYNKYRPRRTPYLLGWGYGADLGGLAEQPSAPGGPDISYPFKSYDRKVTFQRQRTGERTFDYTKEGVAHYGLYADWFEDLRRRGGKRLVRDMWNGAEAYLQMWERASGIRVRGCQPRRGRVTARGLRRLRLGMRWKRLLRRAGQPQQRTRAWSYCVRGRGNRRAADVAELTRKGRVELVGSTALGHSAGGIAVGEGSSSLGGATRSAGGGVFVASAGRGSSYVYYLKRGRIRVVGVATRKLARRPARLRKAMRRVRKARATNARRRFVPNPAAGSARPTGTTLAGSRDPRLNRELLMLCKLNS